MLACRGKLDCVWTNRPVRARDLDVDHAIPYSLSRNNDLWNLLPTHRFVNAKKRDRVPSPQLVAVRAGCIREYWESLRRSYTDLFEREFRVSLSGIGQGKIGADWGEAGITALERKCEYLIEERGFPPREG